MTVPFDSPPPSAAPPPSPAAGWYPEPGSEGVLRYWNGSKWEDWRQPAVPVPTAPVQTNGIAVTALVFALVGIVLDSTIIGVGLGIVCSVVGFICATAAQKKAARFGRGAMATWALWLALVPIVIVLLIVLIGVANHRPA